MQIATQGKLRASISDFYTLGASQGKTEPEVDGEPAGWEEFLGLLND